MKPENIMLLGFVNKACEYLDEHFDEPGMELTELQNIDFDLLKKELSKGLDESLGNMSSTVQTLLQAGSDAFDDFINSQEDKNTLSDELERLFDINFDNNEVGSDDDVARLLDFYQLDNDDNKQDEEVQEVVEPEKNETIFEMSDDAKELLKVISENVNKTHGSYKEELIGDDTKYSNDSNFDNIYSQLIDGNGNFDSIRFSNPGLSSLESYEESKIEEPVISNDSYEIFNNLVGDPTSLQSNFSDAPIEQPDKDDIIDLVKDMQQSDKQYYAHILNQDFEEPEPVKPTRFQEIYSFGNSLIDDLKRKMYEEDEINRKNKEEFEKIYNRVHASYAYLSEDFVKNIYANKDTIDKDFPHGIKIIILHRVHFSDVENLRQFVEITLDHGYSINADESKMIVDVFKQYINEEGKILSSILTIANQSSLLNGEYEGYRVLYEKEV